MPCLNPRPVAALLLAATVLVGCGSSDDGSTATSTTRSEASTSAPTSTSAAATSTSASAPTSTTAAASTTTTQPASQPSTAIWPFLTSSERFTDPAKAAGSFATGYLGFVAPVVGAFQQGDARSGEVPIRPEADGPVTTVLVRQVTGDDSWWVIGASTPNLQLASPAALATITSPVTLSGTSTAFEATVNVEIRQDGSTDALVATFVMGGANGEMGPFSKPVAFNTPTERGGAIILKTESAKDGSIVEASVVRVTFPG